MISPPRYFTDALNNALIGAAITSEIAWPNRVYAPKKGVPFFDVQMAGRARTPLGFGQDSVEQWTGIYQVGVMVPRDTGDRDQDILAAKVLAAFPRGLNLTTNNGNYLTIEYSTVPGPVAWGDWSLMPVQIHWFATELP
jgi:hypothetical protein